MAIATKSTAGIISTSSINTGSFGGKKHDLLDKLKYWQHLDNPSLSARSVLLHDVRGEESMYTLEHHGFQYIRHPVTELKDWSDENEVERVLIPATEELVRQVTGAIEIITFAHRIRCLAVDKRQLAESQAPAHNVHCDFSQSGAVQHLRDTVKDDGKYNRFLEEGRVLAINVWRPLKEIRKDPLAVCDWTSVTPETDLVANRMIFAHGWKELALVNFNEKHRWYYLHGQTPSEPVLFKQFEIKVFAFLPN